MEENNIPIPEGHSTEPAQGGKVTLPRKYKIVLTVSTIVILMLVLMNGFLFYQFMNLDTSRDVVITSNDIDGESDDQPVDDSEIDEDQDEVTNDDQVPEDPSSEVPDDDSVFEDQNVYENDDLIIYYPSTWTDNVSAGPDGGGLSFTEDDEVYFSIAFGLASYGSGVSDDNDSTLCEDGEGEDIESVATNLVYRKIRNNHQYNTLDNVFDICISKDGGATFIPNDELRSPRYSYNDDYPTPEVLDTILKNMVWK